MLYSTRALVLTARMRSRLRPYTLSVAKPLLEVTGPPFRTARCDSDVRSKHYREFLQESHRTALWPTFEAVVIECVHASTFDPTGSAYCL